MTKKERDAANAMTRAENASEKQNLEEIMRMGLASIGWPPDECTAFVLSERMHGVLRPSAPAWLVRSSGETWPESLRQLAAENWIHER